MLQAPPETSFLRMRGGAIPAVLGAAMAMPFAAAPSPAPGGFGGAQPPSPAPPMASPALPSRAPGMKKRASKGLMERAKDALGSVFSARSEEGAAPFEADTDDRTAALVSGPDLGSFGAPAAAVDARRVGDPIFAVLSRQLANGLFDDGDDERDDELRLVRSTERALVALLRLDVDGSHALHGEVVRKAVLALLPLLARLADRALAERAFLVAWAAASAASKRTRKQVVGAASGAGFDLRDRILDEIALRVTLTA
jgi:hypothetical protein